MSEKQQEVADSFLAFLPREDFQTTVRRGSVLVNSARVVPRSSRKCLKRSVAMVEVEGREAE